MGKKPTAIEVKTNRFKIILKSRNISIQKLADSIGYTRPGLSKAINSGKMDPKTLDDISVYLNISPDFFTGEEPLKRVKPEKYDLYTGEFGKMDPSGYLVPSYDVYQLKNIIKLSNSTPITEMIPAYGLLNQAFLEVGKAGVYNPKTQKITHIDQNFIDDNFNFLIPETVDFMRLQIIDAENNSERYTDFLMDEEADAEFY